MLEYNKNIKSTKNIIDPKLQSKEYEPAEVVDVIYNENHPRYSTNMDIGSIVFRRLFTDFNKKYNQLPIAKPSNPYIKIYPLRYEIVTIFESISAHTGVVQQGTTYYYDNTINVWNLINNNALPFSTISTEREKQEDYTKFTGVNSKKTQNIILGEYFSEQSTVNKLQPFEGDIIFEGRFGQSIRFGNTTTPYDKNAWSKQGKAGEPIIIINTNRNNEVNFKFKTEDINNDDSNVWITTGQTIPIKLTAKERKGFVKQYTPDEVNKYNKPQIICNTDRIILNAKKDSIILSSDKSTYLTSNDNIVLNSENYIGLNSNKIYLGDKTASNEQEPFVLGTQLLNTLIEIIDNLLIMIFGTGVGPTTPMLPPAQTNFINLKTKLTSLKYILSTKIYGE